MNNLRTGSRSGSLYSIWHNELHDRAFYTHTNTNKPINHQNINYYKRRSPLPSFPVVLEGNAGRQKRQPGPLRAAVPGATTPGNFGAKQKGRSEPRCGRGKRWVSELSLHLAAVRWPLWQSPPLWGCVLSTGVTLAKYKLQQPRGCACVALHCKDIVRVQRPSALEA